ncbi:MAG: DUF433 domain-containing protein [Chloroflexi bacterium]|nr:DUF433 domain-containing protein [Chloroflexota bacterium]
MVIMRKLQRKHVPVWNASVVSLRRTSHRKNLRGCVRVVKSILTCGVGCAAVNPMNPVMRVSHCVSAVHGMRSHSMIESTPDVLGGKPRIAGTRIRVQDIVGYHLLGGWSVEQVAEELDITPAQIYATLSHYYSHHDEIDRDIEASKSVDPDLLQAYESRRAKVTAKLEAKQNSSD